MQESTVYRSIQKEAQAENTRAIAIAEPNIAETRTPVVESNKRRSVQRFPPHTTATRQSG
jgi:hypothetical protein